MLGRNAGFGCVVWTPVDPVARSKFAQAGRRAVDNGLSFNILDNSYQKKPTRKECKQAIIVLLIFRDNNIHIRPPG
jgi:hypothetical protein